MTRPDFDRLAIALFEAAGLEHPFGEDLTPREKLYAKHHGGNLGECLQSERCPSCAAVVRDVADLQAGREVGLTVQEDADLREKRRYLTPLESLPPGINPRSMDALRYVEAEINRQMYPGSRPGVTTR